MASRPRSLKYEYELYVEREIERYKESVPRSALLKIGDEAVAALRAEQQLALDELLLCTEVDRIIHSRLRLPAYATWRKRRLKTLRELRRPEHWGLAPDDALVRMLNPAREGRVLVAGAEERTTLFFAANGCEVTAIDQEEDLLQRVMDAAASVGIAEQVSAYVTDLGSWEPDEPLTAVVCMSSAFDGLSAEQRRRAIEVLQRATQDGGIHLVEALVNGRATLSMEELSASYAGWIVTVERKSGTGSAFVARKSVA